MPHPARAVPSHGTSTGTSPTGTSPTRPSAPSRPTRSARAARRTARTLTGLGAVVVLGVVAACTPLPYEPPATPETTTEAAEPATAAPTETPTGQTPDAAPACTTLEESRAAGGGSDVDPAAFPTGPSTATFADEAIDPVADAPAPQLPVTVESVDGRTVEVADVSRIIPVDLYGTLGEIVYSLGLGDNVVGRDLPTGFPEAADVPVVTGAGHALDVEAILGLDPSVILTDATILTDDVRSQLEQSGVPVVYFDDARTLDGVDDRIRAVATALGVPAEGEALVERTDRQICAALDAVPTDTGDPRVAFLYLRGANIKMLFGPGSGADDLVRAIGGEDAGTAIGLTQEYAPVTSEAIIAAAPDAYLVMTDGLESMGGLDAMMAIPGLAQTPAGEAQRVVDMDGSRLLTFGPRTGATLASLVEAFYGVPAPELPAS
ncbi:heme/hemin ABC transporter substrate-binding protein [Cellulosimicrobium marinum]|uniref:heme/hemin ABC transporter substrate-binding protein n=1 Tax=Cellulosimicrobium marinum TaxID=1638992 RepID=UPI001E56B7A2|nr:ABC transporter substrate-binding protein [Cellulosimicrobium marinum]MCB7135039.1 ABC transporter substrate-binding protein [Cellulosimicrobium marinum]